MPLRGPCGVSPGAEGVRRPGVPFRPASRWGTHGVSPSEGAPEGAGGEEGPALPSPPRYLRAAVPGPGGLLLLLLLPARLRRRGGGGDGGGGSPGGGGGAHGPLPLSSPGRRRRPYLGPPRLGPWTACGRGMAAPSSGVPARDEESQEDAHEAQKVCAEI
nr:spidroin-2-like [Globicephala melas]